MTTPTWQEEFREKGHLWFFQAYEQELDEGSMEECKAFIQKVENDAYERGKKDLAIETAQELVEGKVNLLAKRESLKQTNEDSI